jgi:hypothetical protein
MHQYSRGSARAPELIKICIAGLAGVVLADENCRIWVMQQITGGLHPAGPASGAGAARH